jgi:hypothetical protein
MVMDHETHGRVTCVSFRMASNRVLAIGGPSEAAIAMPSTCSRENEMATRNRNTVAGAQHSSCNGTARRNYDQLTADMRGVIGIALHS